MGSRLNKPTVPRVVIFGSGNVATHLAAALDPKVEITHIVSRDKSHALALASRLKRAEAVEYDCSNIPEADIYILSVNDDSITTIAHSTPGSGLWLHTSGSVPVDVFAQSKSRFGVLYPLQTFSKNVAVDMAKVPLFIEGSDSEVTAEIESLARLLSPRVVVAGSDTRRKLHIAAVFACNFATRLWAIADGILAEAGLGFDVLGPLLQATLDKSLAVGPVKAQTGPASRGDLNVVNSHLSTLSGDNEKIYRLISDSIMNSYQN